MSERVQIILIAAVFLGVVIIALVYYKRAKRLRFDVNRDGLRGELDALDPAEREAARAQNRPSVRIADVHQSGAKHKIGVKHSSADLEDIKQKGRGHEINVGPDDTSK